MAVYTVEDVLYKPGLMALFVCLLDNEGLLFIECNTCNPPRPPRQPRSFRGHLETRMNWELPSFIVL